MVMIDVKIEGVSNDDVMVMLVESYLRMYGGTYKNAIKQIKKDFSRDFFTDYFEKNSKLATNK